jgi:hypothetical protein
VPRPSERRPASRRRRRYGRPPGPPKLGSYVFNLRGPASDPQRDLAGNPVSGGPDSRRRPTHCAGTGGAHEPVLDGAGPRAGVRGRYPRRNRGHHGFPDDDHVAQFAGLTSFRRTRGRTRAQSRPWRGPARLISASLGSRRRTASGGTTPRTPPTISARGPKAPRPAHHRALVLIAGN